MNGDYFLNSSVFDVIRLYWNDFYSYVSNQFSHLYNSRTGKFVSAIESIPDSLYFDEFQWTLLKGFLLILILNLICIVLAWAYYGKRICERFMKLTHSSKAIEELKASVSRLKLPKEHTPRI